jgi:hypothetical protein
MTGIGQRLPAAPSDVSAAWLTDALAARHPGVHVVDVEVTEAHEATNTHARLRLSYDTPTRLPSAMFAKMLPLDPERRVLIARTGMGLLETRFYADLAGSVGLRVPEMYVAVHDDADGSFVLLVEDLASTGCTVSDGTWGVAPDSAARALEELAELHVRFEDAAVRRRDASWVPPAVHGSTYGTNLLQYALDHHRDRLSTEFAEISELCIGHGDVLHEVWQRGPTTVIHGDPHIGNLFDDHGRTGFLDWGIVKVSTAMRDVGYFLCMALSVDDRRRHERDLLRHYLGARAALGGSAIGFDDAWLAHRVQAAYTVLASCQIVTFPRVSERRRIFSEAFLARSEAAIADLQSRAALREVAGV